MEAPRLETLAVYTKMRNIAGIWRGDEGESGGENHKCEPIGCKLLVLEVVKGRKERAYHTHAGAEERD